MPTIEVNRSDLEALLGETLTQDRFASLLPLVKGEIKEWNHEEIKLELNDSNRPDLWSPEGIARQIRMWEKGLARKNKTGSQRSSSYTFFRAKAHQKIIISEAVMAIRPYLGAFLVRGVPLTESVLTVLIQSQEKLAEIFGQKRKSVSIGLYRLQTITFPVRYTVADPDTTRFIPLGFDHPMSLREILENHPKGILYKEILKGYARYPILIDAKDQILSFPPIINSRTMGEVRVGDTDLMVEVTGCDLRMVLLTVNVFACNLFDRGGVLEPLTIAFPQKTDFGLSIKMPYHFSKEVNVALSDFEKALGQPVSFKEAKPILTSYGYTVFGNGQNLRVRLPPYRDDVMHPMDVVEDFAISRGYETFVPILPSTATIGSESPSSHRSRRLAEAMVGFGFEETISNVLSSYEEQIDRMAPMDGANKPLPMEAVGEGVQPIERMPKTLLKNRPEGRVLSIENPMTQRYAIPRSWLLPSLLRVESVSSKAYYPHRLFEIGEIARRGKRDRAASSNPCETALHLAALIAYADARFSEMHAVLSALFYSLSIPYQLVPIAHPTFIEGRAGILLKQDQEIGIIGEIHPEVLTCWDIGVPSVAFEMNTELL